MKALLKKIIPLSLRNSVRTFWRRAKTPFYIGNKHECNCCGIRLRTFISWAGRPNAYCPNCGSKERSRLLLMYLKQETRIWDSSLKVLHFAPQKCIFDHLVKLDVEYIDGDINPLHARNVVDITNIHYPDNYFDLIICSHTLGHVPDEAAGIKEMHRVLHPDGKALILTYLKPGLEKTFEDPTHDTDELRTLHYGEPDCQRNHGLDFTDRLKAGGFDVERVDYRLELDQKIRDRFVLGNGEREIIFVGTK